MKEMSINVYPTVCVDVKTHIFFRDYIIKERLKGKSKEETSIIIIISFWLLKRHVEYHCYACFLFC
jgi:hypothetical protein